MAHKSSISLHEYSVENSFDLGPRNHNIRSEETLSGSRAPGTISISLALFEKLTQQRSLDDHHSAKPGNPTPVALLGNLLSLTPLACDLMGWRASGGHAYASTTVYMFMGGLLMIIGSIMEWYMGNTFSFVVFAALGGFWLSFGTSLIPWFYAAAAYSKTGSHAEGSGLPAFQSGTAFFLLFMGVLSFVFLVCSLRTNIVLVVVFLTLTVAFPMLAGADWQLSQQNVLLALDLQKIAAAFLFVTSIAGWYAFVGSMLQTLDFPFDLPMGDLHIIPSGTDLRKLKGGEV
ncbi:MAG: hypothetical protein M1839_009436 [Geoglossum umbratile]|nr:MAG: hypothetical protein M1839_009436 [Geoglossum umbratile]